MSHPRSVESPSRPQCLARKHAFELLLLLIPLIGTDAACSITHFPPCPLVSRPAGLTASGPCITNHSRDLISSKTKAPLNLFLFEAPLYPSSPVQPRFHLAEPSNGSSGLFLDVPLLTSLCRSVWIHGCLTDAHNFIMVSRLARLASFANGVFVPLVMSRTRHRGS